MYLKRQYDMDLRLRNEATRISSGEAEAVERLIYAGYRADGLWWQRAFGSSVLRS